MKECHLNGLEGTNPLGFLAALGAQVAFQEEDEQPCLWWSDDITPHAIFSPEFPLDRIVTQFMVVIERWKNSAALNPKFSDGSEIPKGDELKMHADHVRKYLEQARCLDGDSSLGHALVAEGSLDRQGASKPTDFYFTAGQQKFLLMVRSILGGVTSEDIRRALQGPWKYESTLPSLMWDVADDRVYALSAMDPSKDKKKSNPGAEALALLGLSRYPVFAGLDRTLTQGCTGSWKEGRFSWPLWCRPASFHAVKSLLAHAYDHDDATERRIWYPSWGIFAVLASPIRRTGQGGYGTFSPPETAWQAESFLWK